jgi:hypothetical protein
MAIKEFGASWRFRLFLRGLKFSSRAYSPPDARLQRLPKERFNVAVLPLRMKDMKDKERWM